jgi:hypothetical protein
MVKITKATALGLFKEGMDITGVTDKPQLGEAWCMYIDRLHRDGYITDHQVNNWVNPFYK